jgi:hypothetical protein
MSFLSQSALGVTFDAFSPRLSSTSNNATARLNTTFDVTHFTRLLAANSGGPHPEANNNNTSSYSNGKMGPGDSATPRHPLEDIVIRPQGGVVQTRVLFHEDYQHYVAL